MYSYVWFADLRIRQSVEFFFPSIDYLVSVELSSGYIFIDKFEPQNDRLKIKPLSLS